MDVIMNTRDRGRCIKELHVYYWWFRGSLLPSSWPSGVSLIVPPLIYIYIRTLTLQLPDV